MSKASLRTPARAREGASKPKTDYDAVGIEAICDMIREGKSYRDIAKRLGCDKSNLLRWIHRDPTRAASAREALISSADDCDEEAEHILRTMEDVGRARELAQHLRWRAKCRNPRVYGEKQSLEVEGSLGVYALTDEQIDARLKALAAGGTKPAGT